MGTSEKGPSDYLEIGTWNAVCYECGAKMKANRLKKHWQGYWVCPEHWEPRHPQDFVKAVEDNQTVPWAQPDPAPDYVTYTINPNFIPADVGSSILTTVTLEPITTESGVTFITSTGVPGSP